MQGVGLMVPFNPVWENDLEICPYCGSELIEEELVTSSDDCRIKTAHMICFDCDRRWHEKFVYVERVELIEGGSKPVDL